MDAILVKIFAAAVAMSQVLFAGDDVKTEFDPIKDRATVEQLLKNGCTQMRKSFDIEDIDLDELIDTAMKDPQARAGEIKAFKGLNFSDLHTAYRQFCKNERVATSPVDLGEVIAFYNKAMTDLPDHHRLKGYRLPGTSIVLDGKGERFAEVFEPNHRRIWIPLSEVPQVVQKAFIAAEDRRFHEHAGVDRNAVIRAFVTSVGRSGRPQGGSTITQQVVKTLLVGDDLSYERKIREIAIASRVEKVLSKQEILELYLNSIYLGRGAWGIEMAAQTYFGKPARDLTLKEGALLAGLAKGPNYYSPDRHPGRARERLAYVLNRLQDGGVTTSEIELPVLVAQQHRRDIGSDYVAYVLNPLQEASFTASEVELPPLVARRGRRDIGYHYVDHVTREAKKVAGITSLTTTSYVVRSTINPALQRAAEIALQDGLARYEASSGRARFGSAEINLRDAIKRIEAEQTPEAAGSVVAKPAWRQALERTRLPLYDVHWNSGVVLDMRRDGKKGEDLRVGLRDGRILRLAYAGPVRRNLNIYDVVYVRVVEESKGRYARAELRVRPTVQGAALVLENKTGRVLAMAGGFSYPLSQLNRVAQAARQPGSALKPLIFLAALNRGLQPNTTVLDAPITLPPIGGGRYSRPEHYWTPKNYGGDSKGPMTLRAALENSRNLVTARLLAGGIKKKPEDSLKQVCTLAKEVGIYSDCIPYYPFVLGAQPVRMIDLATFYATIANEGMRPEPHTVEAVLHDGDVIYRHPTMPLVAINAADKVAFYQLKSILQGVLARGTGRRIGYMAHYVGGKTGTSTDWNDAWFVGFTNDVTVAVWVGYDNRGKRRTLGGGGTGSGTAIPIFEPIMKASWEHVAPRAALAPPSPQLKGQLVVTSTGADDDDDRRGKRRKRWSFTEYLRADKNGRIFKPDFTVAAKSEDKAKPEDTTRGPRAKSERRPEEKTKRAQRRSPNEYRRSPWDGSRSPWEGYYNWQ